MYGLQFNTVSEAYRELNKSLWAERMKFERENKKRDGEKRKEEEAEE